MHRLAAALLVVICASQAQAQALEQEQSCPSFYRFVDFGLKGRDGVLRRGGTIFRAFRADGIHLLRPESSTCLEVEELARDGRAHPIPVVSSIGIDAQIAGLDLTELRLAASEDMVTLAAAKAASHRENLARTDAIIARGESFLCARSSEPETVSCQMLSPHPGNFPLVVYCGAGRCTTPVMARDEQLFVTASWRHRATDIEELADEISNKLKQIHTFFEQQI